MTGDGGGIGIGEGGRGFSGGRRESGGFQEGRVSRGCPIKLDILCLFSRVVRTIIFPTMYHTYTYAKKLSR